MWKSGYEFKIHIPGRRWEDTEVFGYYLCDSIDEAGKIAKILNIMTHRQIRINKVDSTQGHYIGFSDPNYTYPL